MLDTTCEPQDKDGAACRSRPVAADRLFAISAVSGSATGAAFYAAAVANADLGRKGVFEAPCAADDRPGRFALWFRSVFPRTWRDCLEAIASEDFLSRTVIGLAFRDQVPFIGSNETDRAALLENAWIAAFAKAVQDRHRTYRLSDPFHVFAPSEGQWRPLLVMNGTSAETGRRIVTSHLAVESGGERLFVDAYDFWHVVRSRAAKLERGIPECEPSGNRPILDLSLATAATNSARFPVISPPGTIACRPEPSGTEKASQRTWDRVLDGGYFENFGATSALEIVQGLRARGLDPVVLLVTNDPATTEAAAALIKGRNNAPPAPDTADRPWLSWATVPAGGLYQTRSARGTHTVAYLAGELAHPPPKAANRLPRTSREHLFHIALFQENDRDGEAKEVSMSWWLSKAVQEFIDRQLPPVSDSWERDRDPERVGAVRENADGLECVRRAIRAPTAPGRQIAKCEQPGVSG
jgi:hypothetical protein